jgi:hypothetical protein
MPTNLLIGHLLYSGSLSTQDDTNSRRTRKVKCDEAKPVCNRCRTTGRTCDGYGIWGGGGNDYIERYCSALRKKSIVLPNPHRTSSFSSEECTYLQWFRCRVVQSVSGFFDQSLWKTLIAPGTWTEPAIMHAVVALSAAHRSGVCQRQGLQDIQEHFTLRQYSKAIRLLRPILANKNPASIMVVLVTCLLFTFLEYLRGQYKTAALHLHMGLRLFKDMHVECAELVNGVLIIQPATYKRAFHIEIVQCFASLHVQADLFGNHLPDIALILQVTETEIPSPVFASLQEARDSMDKLLHGILLLTQRVRAAMTGSAEWSPTFSESQDRALTSLTKWHSTYQNTTASLDSVNKRQILAYTLLLNYHTMATIMCKSIFSTCETVYAEHTDEFINIIERSITLWTHYSSVQDTESSGMTVDMGWIPPLYYTALKCRVPRIRSHAIRLLQSVPRKEGVWDSRLAANIAERMKQMEEQSCGGSLGLERDFVLDEVPCLRECERTPTLPTTDLFNQAHVELAETNSVILTCKKFGYHSNDLQRYRFDGQQWLSMEPTGLASQNTIPTRG